MRGFDVGLSSKGYRRWWWSVDVGVEGRGDAGGGGVVGEIAWVRELGDDELAVVFEGWVAVVEVLEAVAVDGDEFFVVACAAIGRVGVGGVAVVTDAQGVPALVVRG